ncbi:MAG: PAS domain S-box protein [Deltaproteobacteria bacterium]|nr:PAS domain S-box protein [Candidatus Desulfobacula maris]
MGKWILLGAFVGFFIFHPFIMIINHIMNEPIVIHGHSLLDIIFLEVKMMFSTKMMVWSLSFTFLGAIVGLFCGKTKQTVAALKNSEKKYRDIFNNIPGMVYRGKSDWTTEIIVNSEMICGYLLNEIDNQKINWTNLIHPDDKQQIFTEAAKIMEKELSITQEYRILAKDGSTQWVSDHKTSFFKPDGYFAGVDGIVYNITERKHLEEKLKSYSEHLEDLVKERTAEIENTYQALEKSEKRYRKLISTMQEGLVEVDSDWHMLFINDRFTTMLGYSHDQLIGKLFQDFIDEKYLGEVEKQISLRHQGKSSSYEVEMVRSDGSKIFVLCSPNPSYDPNGKYLGGFGVISDITELKLREKDREELVEKLQKALENIKTLRGLIPICSSCKKIRDDQGYWNILESYIQKNSDAQFSHSICPGCSEKLYGNEDWYIEMLKEEKQKK